MDVSTLGIIVVAVIGVIAAVAILLARSKHTPQKPIKSDICRHCGAKLDPEDLYCDKCGTRCT